MTIYNKGGEKKEKCPFKLVDLSFFFYFESYIFGLELTKWHHILEFL